MYNIFFGVCQYSKNLPIVLHENLQTAYEKFAAHIEEETEKAREAVDSWIDDPRITTVDCVDGLTKKGQRNPPRGGMFLMNEGLLDQFLQAREGTGFTLAVETVGSAAPYLAGYYPSAIISP